MKTQIMLVLKSHDHLFDELANSTILEEVSIKQTELKQVIKALAIEPATDSFSISHCHSVITFKLPLHYASLPSYTRESKILNLLTSNTEYVRCFNISIELIK